ncbi:MAG: alpha/beta hydrolase [Lachnospiraceae bacterium]|nr:alpha/beta hydrolase [Lachnospiraceae bacterium]
MLFTEQTTIRELMEMPELQKVKSLLFTNMDEEKASSTLADYGTDKTGMYHSLYYTAAMCLREDFIIPLYSPEECKDNPALADVCLLNFAVHPGKETVIICPGGGYNREWVLVEGYPLADDLNRLNTNAFILIYRTGKFHLFPEPLDDLARAIAYLDEHQEELQISMSHYALTGASAGGHLIAQWGTKVNGYAHYNLPRPGALLMSYPAANLTGVYRQWESCIAKGEYELADSIAPILQRIGHETFTRDEIEKYSLDCTMDEDFPPTYLVHCEDDPTVPISNTHQTINLFDQHHITYRARIAPRGGHSFGLGIHTDAKGWLHDAVRFWRQV